MDINVIVTTGVNVTANVTSGLNITTNSVGLQGPPGVQNIDGNSYLFSGKGFYLWDYGLNSWTNVFLSGNQVCLGH